MKPQRILIVDDEANMLTALRRVLRGEDYETLTAQTPGEALEIVQEDAPDLVISDQNQPGMTGIELLERVKEISPRTVRILLTGAANLEAAKEAINRCQVYRFLSKPWDNQDLKTTIRQALEQQRLQTQNAMLVDTVNEQNQELRSLNRNLEQKVEERTAEARRLFSELQDQFVQSIRVFVDLVGLRDSNLAEHCKRVAAVSKVMATHLQLTKKDIFDVEIAGILHDIGKLGMPESTVDWASWSLLGNVDSLSPNVEALLKQHPILGQDVIKSVASLKNVGVIVRHHHERFDGQGYPDRLQRDDIPLGARLIAVADTYDRALYTRKYGGRMTQEDALSLLGRLSGYDLDPELVTLFTNYAKNRNRDTPQAVEVRIGIHDLLPGMVTARNVRTNSGVLIIGKGETLTTAAVQRLQRHDQIDAITSGVYVLTTPLMDS